MGCAISERAPRGGGGLRGATRLVFLFAAWAAVMATTQAAPNVIKAANQQPTVSQSKQIKFRHNHEQVIKALSANLKNMNLTINRVNHTIIQLHHGWGKKLSDMDNCELANFLFYSTNTTDKITSINKKKMDMLKKSIPKFQAQPIAINKWYEDNLRKLRTQQEIVEKRFHNLSTFNVDSKSGLFNQTERYNILIQIKGLAHSLDLDIDDILSQKIKPQKNYKIHGISLNEIKIQEDYWKQWNGVEVDESRAELDDCNALYDWKMDLKAWMNILKSYRIIVERKRKAILSKSKKPVPKGKGHIAKTANRKTINDKTSNAAAPNAKVVESKGTNTRKAQRRG